MSLDSRSAGDKNPRYGQDTRTVRYPSRWAWRHLTAPGLCHSPSHDPFLFHPPYYMLSRSASKEHRVLQAMPSTSNNSTWFHVELIHREKWEALVS